MDVVIELILDAINNYYIIFMNIDLERPEPQLFAVRMRVIQIRYLADPVISDSRMCSNSLQWVLTFQSVYHQLYTQQT